MIAHSTTRNGTIPVELDILPADLLFCYSGGLLGKAIRWAETGPGEERTYANHIAGVNWAGMVVEALWTVKKTPWATWEASHDKFELWRNTELTEEDRFCIADAADEYAGRKYGWWKLGIHLADALIFKVTGKDAYLFRRALTGGRYPICYWIWTYPYAKKEITFGQKPNAVDPDEMHDYVRSVPTWTLIHKKG
ncbi:MAG: hypothetical protein ABIK28_18200 [Planctomycetota bacterium]